ncbi:hypothetical protein OTUT144_0425 [Orientia tsutsugamushi str. UT144]|uniref:Uncharacterized protein n=1 Tax=Orientia tsutsugamushi str. UT144 TaxID=1441384 RepID=A0A0F3RN96_ORITS|nr:hypothetical protein [Orientia tsutsugamushi]KJW07516.1 hypothetical protein OTUT144_0425 [Orientia tsutsugamushi str. UT144]
MTKLTNEQLKDLSEAFTLAGSISNIPERSSEELTKKLSNKLGADAIDMTNGGIQALISSSIYKLLLQNQAVPVELVISDENNSKLLARHHSSGNIVPLSKFSGLTSDSRTIEANSPNLKKLVGLENIIAACNIVGDMNYSAKDLMVRSDNNTIVKTNCMEALVAFNANLKNMMWDIRDQFDQGGYASALEAGTLSFDIRKYASALNQMLAQLDENQIDNLVEQQVDELKKAGFNPEGLEVMTSFNGKLPIYTAIDSNEQLKNFYKQTLKQSVNNMKPIAKDLSIIAKFTNASQEFIKGKWIKAFAFFNYDPITYAYLHNIKIEDKSPLGWAALNNYPVKVDDIKNISSTRKVLESELRPLVQKLQGLPAKQLTFKQVKSLYDSVLEKLKAMHYLTDTAVECIKKSNDYHSEVKSTFIFAKINDCSMSTCDRICYKLAQLCNKLSLHGIANFFIKQVSPKALDRMHKMQKHVMSNSELKSNLIYRSMDCQKLFSHRERHLASKAKKFSNKQRSI